MSSFIEQATKSKGPRSKRQAPVARENIRRIEREIRSHSLIKGKGKDSPSPPALSDQVDILFSKFFFWVICFHRMYLYHKLQQGPTVCLAFHFKTSIYWFDLCWLIVPDPFKLLNIIAWLLKLIFITCLVPLTYR